ncbi:MAG: cell division protein FtsQ/DivIB [Alcanivorax sp.]|nr:cell division protein FtsQ/DivIB [Alcanivorax sp.]
MVERRQASPRRSSKPGPDSNRRKPSRGAVRKPVARARKAKVAKQPSVPLAVRVSRLLPWLLASVALLAVGAGLMQLPAVLESYPLEQVRVEGVQDQRRQLEVQESVAALVQNENFFSVPLAAVYREVSTLAWVDDTEVRRQWPDQLVLKIAERVPVAVWNNEMLVASSGEPFHALEQYSVEALPRLSGPAARLEDVMSYYHSMSRILGQANLSIRRMQVDARLGAEVELEDGVVLLVDREHYAAKLHRFVQLYQGVLGDDPRYLARVDLRYANGMAVTWADEAPHSEMRSDERV